MLGQRRGDGARENEQGEHNRHRDCLKPPERVVTPAARGVDHAAEDEKPKRSRDGDRREEDVEHAPGFVFLRGFPSLRSTR